MKGRLTISSVDSAHCPPDHPAQQGGPRQRPGLNSDHQGTQRQTDDPDQRRCEQGEGQIYDPEHPLLLLGIEMDLHDELVQVVPKIEASGG